MRVHRIFVAAFAVLLASSVSVHATSVCDFDGDGDCDVEDLNGFANAFKVNDLAFDLDGSGIVDLADQVVWLDLAATENGFDSPYWRGDRDLNRKVDITDPKGVYGGFNPLGLNSQESNWHWGDYNGDLLADIVDHNIVVHNFHPGGYGVEQTWNTGDGQERPWGQPHPAPVSAVVDQNSGVVKLVSDRGIMTGLQLVSPGGHMARGDFTADLLQFVISTSEHFYAEGSFMNLPIDGGIDGEALLEAIYPGLQQDLGFKYTQAAVGGTVENHYESEQALVGTVLYSNSVACDLDADGDCDVDDVNQFTAQMGGSSAMHDLDGNGTVQGHDQLLWLSLAAIANGHATMYSRGDTNLDRFVDVTDFNMLATNFEPSGITASKFSNGDGDGDGDIDITDFNRLATDFAPGGYDSAEAAISNDVDPGEVDLIVDLATGEVILDGNAASISGLQVFSAGNSLLTSDFTAEVLQFVISTNPSTYAEGAFVNMAVDGEVSLGILYDVNVGGRDLAFEYTMIGQPTVTGTVVYVPEPASLMLLALGMVMSRRRRGLQLG